MILGHSWLPPIFRAAMRRGLTFCGEEHSYDRPRLDARRHLITHGLYYRRV